MTRSELIQHMTHKYPELTADHVERMVAVIFDEITAALAQHKRAEFRNFGAFSIRHRKARVGRNPRTGAKVPVREKDFPFFKCGRTLLSHMNKW